MLSNIFGKKSKEENDCKQSELAKKIASMNLSELTLYVKEKLEGVAVNEEGLLAVMQRLLAKINDKRYFLDASDDDSKLKKAFELVIRIAKNPYINLKIMEAIAQFFKQYEQIIKEYDKKHKEIYADRIKKSLDVAAEVIEAKVSMQNRFDVLE